MIGRILSHYRITEKLGEGGMGVVYKAEDTNLDRFVALKFLPAAMTASSDDNARFEQEAKAISALNHPAIATIHDIGEVDGKKFLVLEYIPGGTLRARIKKAQADGEELSFSSVIAIGIQIAEGLAHAHREGIVHRDVKSENIMLTKDGNIKITDFGLAKLRTSAQLTKIGSTVGTAGYMSPEQIRGEDVDGRSDLFSLGVVLYEMTTLRMPFRGEHDAALAYSIVNEDAQPAETFRANIPASLAAVIAKCLEKDPALRYSTGNEAALDLRDPGRVSTSGIKLAVKRRLPAVLKIPLAAVLILCVIGIYRMMPEFHLSAPHEKTIAVLPFINLSEQKDAEYFSDGMMEDVLTQLTKIADLKVISRTTMMQYKGVQKSAKEIGKELNVSVILEGSVRRSGDKIRIVAQLIDAGSDEHLWAETYDREFREVFAIQSEIARKIAGSLQATLSPNEKEQLANPQTVNTEAYTAYLQGRYFLDQRSKQDVEKAVGYFEQALKIEPTYALALVGLSMAHGNQADYSYVPVDEGYRKARAEGARALALDPKSADAHTNMGWIKKNYDWDWTGADISFKRAVLLEPRNAAAVRGASAMAFAMGRFDDAVSLAQRAIEFDPLLPSGYYNLGSCEYYAGRQREAEAAFRKALELNPQYPIVHAWLGRVALALPDPEEALTAIRKEPEALWRIQGLALAYHAAGKKHDSDGALKSLIDQFKFSAAFQIAEVYAYRGETDKAFEWLERAFVQRDSGFSAIKGDPLLRSIETDPRYAALMKKLKLPLHG